MICLYLASFLQPENFGPGIIYGIVNGAKPSDIKVDLVFKPFTPSIDFINSYNEIRITKPKEASDLFVFKYKQQLENFLIKVKETLPIDSSDLTELLPFKDGDTLASWERFEFTNYRKILAPYLVELGYKVNLK